jgi:hypothetical protein
MVSIAPVEDAGALIVLMHGQLKEYLVLYLYFVFPLSRDQHNKKKSLKI